RHLEAALLSRAHLRKPADVSLSDRPKLRVTARRLAVRHQDKGLFVAGYLDRAKCNAIRHDVVAPRRGNFGSIEAIGHPVGHRRKGKSVDKKEAQSFWGKIVVWRAKDHAKSFLLCKQRCIYGSLKVCRPFSPVRSTRKPIVFPQHPPSDPADAGT